jgi:hypothetical protein
MLQISADWYKGVELSSVYPVQKNLLRKIVLEGASRCIKVLGIPKGIKHGDLEWVFKHFFPDLVVLRLCIPKKRYEAEKLNSNSVILEFNSESYNF